MNKLRDIFNTITIFYEAALDNPKKSIALALVSAIIIAITYKAVSRVPDTVACWWKASISQDVPSELWRHNLVTNECQYFNKSRWIPIDKVMDVGAGEDFDEAAI